ncbi:FtsQ-type POTRA domain-containing protein [Viridibacillus sp. YIM B01967]|uniref:Cell division protein DivIB n=1 Tax=Viridibacillus soli TaxID=2798301 RepID=A0ABS1H4Z0_9BACL|nr:cell division protein FtsQ/DivIB [Viridibacillus soli]MBK3494488.1 FtsQ-type POTRA domain-containing protein [Viridibacillus soli]
MEKIIDIEERIPTLRERRKKRTNLRFTILLAIFGIILLALLYFQSSLSHINKIEVSGGHLKNAEYYSKVSTIRVGDSLWDFKLKNVEASIQKKNWVESVTVERNWLNTVTIKVKEYDKKTFIKQGDRYNLVLQNGVIYNLDELPREMNLPILVGFKEEDLLLKIIKQLDKVDEELMTLISQVNAIPTKSNPYAIRLFMNDGFEVRATITTLAEKLKYYPSIISQVKKGEKGVIDLEVGSFYRSYTSEYGEQAKEEEIDDQTAGK